MFQYLGFFALFAVTLAAPTCDNGVHAVAEGLQKTLVNQTEVFASLGEFIESAFKAGKEYEVSSIYNKIRKSIDHFEETVRQGLESGAFKDELKSLDIEKLVKQYQELDSKQKMPLSTFKDIVRKLKESEKLIQAGTTSSAANKKCEEKMSKLLDVGANALYQGSNDLGGALGDIYYQYDSAEKPATTLEPQLAIAKKVAQTLQTSTARLGELKLSQEQVQSLRNTKYTLESVNGYIQRMQQKENSETLKAIDSAVKATIANINNVLH